MGIEDDPFPRQRANRQNKIIAMLTNQERIDIIRYRIDNAQNTLSEVVSHIQNGFYNTAANRMYYACYYAVSALLIAHGINSRSHDGVKQMFGLHFIQTGVFPSYYGKNYSLLFDERRTGDYEDLFNHDEKSVADLYPKAKEIVFAVKEKIDLWLSENA